MAKTIEQIFDEVGTQLKIIVRGDNYITVEDEEGYRAYMQVEVYGYKYDNPNYYGLVTYATVHKPNRKTGSGYQYGQDKALDVDKIVKHLKKTLIRSKGHIISGRESMDTRKPHESGRYLV